MQIFIILDLREGQDKKFFFILRYDINLLVEKLDKEANLMASNQEKFRTITIGKFQIRDSLEHVPSSLDALMTDFMQG